MTPQDAVNDMKELLVDIQTIYDEANGEEELDRVKDTMLSCQSALYEMMHAVGAKLDEFDPYTSYDVYRWTGSWLRELKKIIDKYDTQTKANMLEAKWSAYNKR